MIPLVLEAISYERPNLIVGDAKQSIYRFNNGLAEQFVALPSLYNPEKTLKWRKIARVLRPVQQKTAL